MNTLVNLDECTDYITFQVDGKQTQVRIVGTNDEPWFCGKDLCVVLEYVDTRQALQKHVKPKNKKSLADLSSTLDVDSTSNFLGKNNVTDEYHAGKAVYINEPGLYSLISGSKALVAERFQDLVYEEILPAIRKHGNYSINKQLETATNQLEQLSIENKAKDEQIAEQSEKLGT